MNMVLKFLKVLKKEDRLVNVKRKKARYWVFACSLPETFWKKITATNQASSKKIQWLNVSFLRKFECPMAKIWCKKNVSLPPFGFFYFKRLTSMSCNRLVSCRVGVDQTSKTHTVVSVAALPSTHSYKINNKKRVSMVSHWPGRLNKLEALLRPRLRHRVLQILDAIVGVREGWGERDCLKYLDAFSYPKLSRGWANAFALVVLTV